MGRTRQGDQSVAQSGYVHRFSVAVVLILALASCSGSAKWILPLARDHPLAGRIWQPASGHFVTAQTVERALAAADFVLLGEKHDNPDHHLLQAALVRAMAGAGRRPAVVFEMIAEDRQSAIERWRAANPSDGAGLGAAVGWEKSGWPPWRTYRPIADAALGASLPLSGGNLSRGLVKKIHKDGLAVLDARRRSRLGLDDPMPKKIAAAMLDTLFESHCRLMPRAALSPMLDVQRARDAILADNMVRGGALEGADGAVLITGSGHARADRGAPMHLARLVPGRSIATLAFVEVEDGETSPSGYIKPFGGKAPFDFVWFTPRIDDRDHCAELEQRFRKR